MKTRLFLLTIIATFVFLAGCGVTGDLTVQEKQQVIKDMETESLEKLYAEKKTARQEIQDSVGYAVFSNTNINLFLLSSGNGYGSVVNNATGERTYMKMYMAGVGLGAGVKDFRQFLIFNDEETMEKFVTSGWSFGGHADAAAKSDEKGGSMAAEEDVYEGIKIYSMTEAGLALQATVAGTKYWKYDELNVEE